MKNKMNKKELEFKIGLLQKKIEPLNKELRKIEDKDSLKEKLLGRYFKFKDSYGYGERWWVYVEVIAVTKDKYTHLIVEREPNGDLKIQLEDSFTYSSSHYLHQVEKSD